MSTTFLSSFSEGVTCVSVLEVSDLSMVRYSDGAGLASMAGIVGTVLKQLSELGARERPELFNPELKGRPKLGNAKSC